VWLGEFLTEFTAKHATTALAGVARESAKKNRLKPSRALRSLQFKNYHTKGGDYPAFLSMFICVHLWIPFKAGEKRLIETSHFSITISKKCRGHCLTAPFH
jgi:hypothetical protein